MRNKVKRTLSFLLTFVMLCSLLPMTAMAKELKPGEVAAQKTASYDETKKEVTITMSVKGKNVEDEITETAPVDVVMVVDNSGSMTEYPGIDCNSTEYTAELIYDGIWIDIYSYHCTECGKWLGLLQPNSGWECSGRITKLSAAQKATYQLIDQIAAKNSDNQIGIVSFAGSEGGTGKSELNKEACIGLQALNEEKSLKDLYQAVNNMDADGGTNYTAAFDKAEEYLSDSDRAKFIIFVSDGQPGYSGESPDDPYWNGLQESAALKEGGAKIYTIGLNVSGNILQEIASGETYHHNFNDIQNINKDLPDLVSEIADEITTPVSKPAGTYAALVDTISKDFTLKPNQNVENLAFNYENNQVIWNVGEITEEGKEVSFVVIPKEGVYGENIPTNAEAKLTYTDVNGESQTLDVANATVNIPAPVAETVTLTYDANGGTGAPETATVNKNTEYYVLNTDTTPTHEPVDGKDVEFKGWSADEAVINQVYEKDNVPATVTTIDIAEENVTVYAVWAYKEEPPVGTVMLNYDANGGTGAPASATVNKNTEVTLDSTTTPTHAEADGKYVTFAGWSNDEAVKGVIYEKGSEPTTVDKVTVGETDVTVYAVWVYGDPVDPVDPPEPPTWELSKDKTATALDSNYNSKVTLSLPAGDYPQTVDVVFTVDCTSVLFYNYTGIIKEIEKIADELAGKDINLNVGLVGFGHESKVYLPLTNITEENVDAVMEEVKTTISNDGDWLRNNGGTNIQKGILTGRELLDNSNTGALPNDQYFILMTDGAGFWYNNANGETVCTAHKGDSNQSLGNMDANNDVGGPTRITDSMYLRAVNEGKTFGDFIAEQGAAIEKSAERSLTTEGAKSAGELAYTTQDVQNYDVYPYLNMERGTYFAAKALQEVAAEGYSVITIGYNYNKFGLTSLNAVSKGFREWTAEVGSYYTASMSNVQDAFEGVRDEMIYLLDAGSQVVDIIGQGKDDKGNDYNFDVANLDNMTITVGGVELNKVKIQSEEFLGSTTYGFFEGEIADDNYDFVVTYYPDGVADADGETREHFVWSINTPVSKYAPAQFSYDVHLTNPQKAKGEYKVETNVEAVLTPVDSNGTVGSTETFPVPELTYEVKGGGSTTEHLMTVIVEGKGKVVVKDVQTVGANDTEVVEIPFGVEKQKFEMEAADGWKLDKVEVTINGKTENLGDVDKYKMDESLIDGAVLKAVFVKDNDGGSGGGGSHRPNNKPDETPEALNGDDHFDYVVGYSDGLVHPERNITRAEVASIFFRLLQDDVREKNLTDQNPFNDVFTDDWFNVAVSTMYDMDIVYGRDNNNFDPNAYITRAEFAAIAARFDSEGYSGENLFTDIDGHWAANQINRAAEKGWISGYPDGTFGPDRYITRAEAVTMINRVLNRLPESADALHEDMKVFVDNADTNAWYYLAIQEATNSHEYKKDKDGVYETWTDVLPARDWAQYLKLN